MEEWKPCPFGYEGLYEVSRLGFVRNARTLHVLAFNAAQHYLRVSLFKNGRTVKWKVHQLVARAFHGECPPGKIPAHGPAGHLDNSAANLSYKTRAENLGEDRRRDGTSLGGPKLTAAIVLECRSRYDQGRGERVQVLAEEFGVALEHMRLVVTGKRWRNIAA